MRNLTKTLAVVSLLIPASAYPLGIGEIKLHSALNQTLDAEISLILSPGEKLSDIKVNLAPPDKYDETGVPWTYFLSKIKFEPITSNGSTVIKISSKEILKEPFLDFLLEVSWPKGNLYREFTVLVDPPDLYQQAAIPLASTRFDEFQPEPAYSPKQQTIRKKRTQVAGNGIDANGYGPVNRNDTLWEIAEQLRDSDVSVEQMLIALYEENPHAFYKANINALLAGASLKIPEKTLILRLSHKQAINEFNRQIQAWKNHQVENVHVETKPDGSTDNQLTLIAPTQEPVSEKAITTAAHEQQVVAEKKPETPPSSPESTNQSSTNGSTPADHAIQDKIAALEKQLAVMQELIALKDQQLAALQNQSQAKLPANVPTEQIVPANVPATKPETPAPGNIDITKSAETRPDNVAVPKPELQPKPVLPRPVAKPAAKPVDHSKTELSDSINWYYPGVAGGGVGLLMLLGWLWWRQRQLENQDNLLAPLTSAAFVKPTKPADVFSESVDTSYGIDLAVGENIFASDFASGDFDVIDMDQGEIDPISEADVYLAYGRYQQAEDLMRDAIADQPERDDCKLKLLEIFYANGNIKAFETYAAELIDAGKQDDTGFWAKVAEMGAEICADSPLFSSRNTNSDLNKHTGIEQIDPSAATDTVNPDELIDEMDFNLASFEELFDSNSDRNMFQEKNDLFDIELSSFENKPEVIENNDEPTQNNESIDFDLSLFSTDAQTPQEINKAEKIIPLVNEVEDEFESFNFDLSVIDAAPQEIEAFDLNITDTPAIDADYHVIDFSTDKTAGFDESEPSNNVQDDSFSDFNFNVADNLNEKGQGSFGISDLSEMDEMETKLDLAIAYIDMGDANAAKEIALEVLKRGTGEQKMVAQALLDGL